MVIFSIIFGCWMYFLSPFINGSYFETKTYNLDSIWMLLFWLVGGVFTCFLSQFFERKFKKKTND